MYGDCVLWHTLHFSLQLILIVVMVVPVYVTSQGMGKQFLILQ